MTDKHIRQYDPGGRTQRKILEARQLVSSSLTPDVLRLIQRDPRNELSGDGGLREALAPIHRKAFEIVDELGLEIRHRGLNYSAMPDQGLGTGIRMNVEFALALPDAPDVLLVWEARDCHDYGEKQSRQGLWEAARRYWLCEQLWLPTEGDAEPPPPMVLISVALGLGATPNGADVLAVEAARLPGAGSMRVSGTVGPKMTESANVALTWVRTNAGRFAGVDASFDDATDLYVHLPDAARSVDGASAGVTVAAAIVSALTGRPVRRDVVMTGELTLGGQVEPVAGIREKVLAAWRSGMATVVLPAANEADVGESFPGGLPSGIGVRYASTMDEVLKVALPDVVA